MSKESTFAVGIARDYQGDLRLTGVRRGEAVEQVRRRSTGGTSRFDGAVLDRDVFATKRDHSVTIA
jgi:hypothetical protein